MAYNIQRNTVWALTTNAQSQLRVWTSFKAGDQEVLLETVTGATDKTYGPFVQDVTFRIEVIEGTFSFDRFKGTTPEAIELSNFVGGGSVTETEINDLIINTGMPYSGRDVALIKDWLVANGLATVSPPNAVLIDGYNDLTGRSGSGAVTPVLDTTRQSEGSGCVVIDSNGTNVSVYLGNTPALMQGVLTDGLYAFEVDWGDDGEAQEVGTVSMSLIRGGLTYTWTSPANLNTAIVGHRAYRGKRWGAHKLSDLKNSGNPIVGVAAGATTLRNSLSLVATGSAKSILAVDSLIRVTEVEPPMIVWTADDAVASQRSMMMDIAAEYGVPITAMIPYDNLGGSNRMVNQDVADLIAAGWEIGCDGSSTDLPMTCFPSVFDAVSDLKRCRQNLISTFGAGLTETTRNFCYPNGNMMQPNSTASISITANGTNVVTVPTNTAWNYSAGQLLIGDTLPASDDIRIFRIGANQNQFITNKPVPAGTYTVSVITEVVANPVVANNTTTVTVPSTSRMVVGMVAYGHGNPSGNRIEEIIDTGTVRMTNAVSSTCVRLAFFNKDAPFSSHKLQDALLAEGFVVGRSTQGGTFFTEVGFDARAAIVVPGQTTTIVSTNGAVFDPYFDEVKARHGCMIPYVHGVVADADYGSSSGIRVSEGALRYMFARNQAEVAAGNVINGKLSDLQRRMNLNTRRLSA